MKIRVITLFPGFFDGPLRTSIVERAMSAGDLEVELVDLRAFGKGVHRQVDDAPFGGGAGMVLMVEPLFKALSSIPASHRVLLSPAGARLEQSTLDRLATYDNITLVCGRYEGVDERVADHLIDEEVSLGDFVLAGGEAAAAALIEGIARLLPGVVGNPESVQFESFKSGLLEEPQYTRPASFDPGDGETWEVPEILLSGDHGKIEAWRAEQRLRRTNARRPDLL
jgi:tRNA (guanine37-N1)-methyltransferase